MKKFILPLSLALAFLVLFIGGILTAEQVAKNRNEVTDKIILKQELERQKQEFDALVKSFFPTYDKYQKVSDKEYVTVNEDNKVTDIYLVRKEEKNLGYLYLITVKGRKPELNMAVGVEIENRLVIGYTVVSNSETPEYYAKITEDFVNQFKSADMKLPAFEFETVTGATQSSTAIVLGINLARQQFYQDLGEELPKASLEYTFVKFYQSLVNLDQYVYTFNDGEKDVEVVLKATTPAARYFEYVSSTETLTEEEITEAIRVAEIAKNRPVTRILSIVEIDGNTQYEIRTNGFGGEMIAKITFDADLKVIAYELTKQNESYPDLTNEMIEKILDAGVNIQDLNPVTGATVTSTALKTMVITIIKTVEEHE